jgi:hypothetical protein
VYRVPANGTGLSELQNRRKCCCFIPALTTSRATPGTVPRYPGTEAAAATGTTIRATAMRMPEQEGLLLNPTHKRAAPTLK